MKEKGKSTAQPTTQPTAGDEPEQGDLFTYDPSQRSPDEKEPVAFEIPPSGSDVVGIVRQKDTEVRIGKTSGERYLNVKLEVLSSPGRGYYIFYSVPLTGQWSATFMGRLLDALGFDSKKPIKFSTAMLVGKRCRFKVKHEVRNGKTRASVQYFLRYDQVVEQVPDIAPRTTTNSSSPTGKNDNLPF